MSQVCIMPLVMTMMKVLAIFSGDVYIEYEDVVVIVFA
jgi:hypothetical protein